MSEDSVKKEDARKKTALENLAKGRAALAEKKKTQKELSKYIIYDSSDDEDNTSSEEEVEKPKKGKGKAKQPKKVLRSTKTIKKAEALKKEIEDSVNKQVEALRNEFKKAPKLPEVEDAPPPVEPPKPVVVPANSGVLSQSAPKPISQAQVIKSGLLTQLKFN